MIWYKSSNLKYIWNWNFLKWRWNVFWRGCLIYKKRRRRTRNVNGWHRLVRPHLSCTFYPRALTSPLNLFRRVHLNGNIIMRLLERQSPTGPWAYTSRHVPNVLRARMDVLIISVGTQLGVQLVFWLCEDVEHPVLCLYFLVDEIPGEWSHERDETLSSCHEVDINITYTTAVLTTI